MADGRVPAVSIGLPVRNGEAFLADTIESLLGQTYEDFELIISDNASTDSTARICEYYVAGDKRVRYLRQQENEGVVANYLATLRGARGELFKWAAHDDVCRPQFLESCVGALDEDPGAVLAYSRAAWIDANGLVTGAESARPALNSDDPAARIAEMADLNTQVTPLFGVIRRSELESVRPHGRYPGADRVLLLELALRGRFVEVPQVLFEFRQHEGQYSAGRVTSQFKVEWWSGRTHRAAAPANWMRLVEFRRAIGQAPLPAQDRRRCYEVLALWAMRYWKRLVLDFLLVTRTASERLQRG